MLKVKIFVLNFLAEMRTITFTFPVYSTLQIEAVC
jgi:hypothetical protein